MEIRAVTTQQIHPVLREIRRIGVWRVVAITILLLTALTYARLSWTMPLARDWERTAYNLRISATAPRVGQDQRIAEVVYNDDTLAALGKRSPLDRSMLARALRNIDQFRPKSIGIDILIDQAQPEDDELIKVLRAIRTPTWLAYTTAEANPDQLVSWQQNFLDSFIARARPGNLHPALIRIEADTDNVVRSWPDRPVGLPPLLSAAMTNTDPEADGYDRSIRFRLPISEDRPEFEKLPIELLADPASAGLFRTQITGRYVLIGGDISDTDLWDTPISRINSKPVIGLDIHAMMIAQMLDKARLARVPSSILWAFALLWVAIGCLTSILDLRTWQVISLVAVEFGTIFLLPFFLQKMGVDTQTVPAAGWGVGWALAYTGGSTAARAVNSEERRFAQTALGRFLPKDIAQAILREPDRLRLSGEKRSIIALFTDLEGFTALTHQLPAETAALMLNRYLDEMCAVILAHGGTVDKFVGDAVVAFWGAPLARADDGDRAVAASVALIEAGARFNAELRDGLPTMGNTRVGLHRGEAIVGNFGGEGRIQYTALGDAMNTAARLESANKKLKTRALVSGTIIEERPSAAAAVRAMGRIKVVGRTTPIDVYEPAPDIDLLLRDRMNELYMRFDAGEMFALVALRIIGSGRPNDAALHFFIQRLEQVGPGGTYELDSK